MNVIIDGTALRLYPLAGDGFSGGTENYVRVLARGLAEKGYRVHVVANDQAEPMERRPNEWWWPANAHPLKCDVLVLVHNMEGLLASDYDAQRLVVATNGIDPWLGDDPKVTREIVDAWPVFSRCHADLMVKRNPEAVDPAMCHITGLGVDLGPYLEVDHLGNAVPYDPGYTQVPGRLLYANDPARGLWHLLDVFDALRKHVPEASLHVAYDFDRQFEPHRWNATALAERLWDCKRRLATTPGVVSLGALDRAELIREQLECQVHAMPSDPPNVGSQIHGLTQMECAAAGAALVLSETEAFPEVFADGAAFLPLPGAFDAGAERRIDAEDWADYIASLMRDPAKWEDASRKARALAQQHTWDAVVDRWDTMLKGLLGDEPPVPGD